MNVKEMTRLTEHFDKYFEQSDSVVIHPIVMTPHIDALLYKPTDKYPFWKLVSMGASDYKMPEPANNLGNRNEYIMMIDPKEDMNDPAVAAWYYSKLIETAAYPQMEKCSLTFGHSIEWKPEDNEEMVGVYIDFPQIIENTGILRCKLSMFKTVVCLMVILINRAEMETLLKIGPDEFREYLFPDEGDYHFLCQRKRTDSF